MEIHYYNLTLTDWEPLLERCTLSVSYNKKPEEIEYDDDEEEGEFTDEEEEEGEIETIEKTSEVSEEEEEEEEINYVQEIVVHNVFKEKGKEGSKKVKYNPLNVTVTQRMLETVKTTQKLWREDFSKMQTVSQKFDPYLVLNHSGYEVSFKPLHEKKKKITLKNGEEMGLNFDDMVSSSSDDVEVEKEWKKDLYISFRVHCKNFNFQQKINVKRIGTRKQQNDNHLLVISVQLIGGRKVITLRSHFIVRNNTSRGWSIGVFIKKKMYLIGNLKAGGERGIPIPFIKEGIFVVKPSENELYKWSENKDIFSFQKMMNTPKSRFLKCFSKKIEEERSRALYLVEDIEILDDGDHVIKLRPPLALENLLPFPIDIRVFDIKHVEHLNIGKTNDKGEKEVTGMMELCKIHLDRGKKIQVFEADVWKKIMITLDVPNPAVGGRFRSKKVHFIYVPPEKDKSSSSTRVSQDKSAVLIDENGNEIELVFEYDFELGEAFLETMIYCPYWIVNHTFVDLNCWFKEKGAFKIAAGQRQLNDTTPEKLYVMENPPENGIDCIIESMYHKKYFLTVKKIAQEERVTILNALFEKGQRWIYNNNDDKRIVLFSNPSLCLEADMKKNGIFLRLKNEDKSVLQEWIWDKKENSFYNVQTKRFLNFYTKKKVNLYEWANKRNKVRFLKSGRYFFSSKDFISSRKRETIKSIEETPLEEEKKVKKDVEVTSEVIEIGEKKKKIKEEEEVEDEEKELKKFLEKDIKVLLFSFPSSFDKDEKKLSISVNQSNVSRLFSLENVGMEGSLELKCGGRRYDIGLYVSLAPGKYSRSKIITFTSRFRIINLTEKVVQVKQLDTIWPYTVKGGEKSNFFWNDSKKKKQLCVKLDNYEWSSPLNPLTGLGENFVKLLPCQNDKVINTKIENKPTSSSSLIYIISVSFKMSAGTVYIVIEDPEFYPYIIHNKLKAAEVSVCQHGIDERKVQNWTVKPQSKIRFCWDDNNMRQNVNIKVNNVELVTKYDFNKLNRKVTRAFKELGGKIQFCIKAKGPTKILVIEKEEIKKEEEEEYDEEIPQLILKVEISPVGISLVNNDPSEILFINFEGVRVDFETTDKHNYISAQLKSIQFDDQSSEKALIPVVLAHHNLQNRPVFQLSVTQLKQKKSSVSSKEKKEKKKKSKDVSFLYLEYCSVNLQEIYVKVDFSFLMRMLDYISLFTSSDPKSRDSSSSDEKSILKVTENIDVDVKTLSSKESLKKMLYFEYFELCPIKINLTVKFSKQENSKGSKNPLLLLLNTVGFTLVNCEDAPLKFSSLKLKNLFSTQNDVISKIKKHYISQGTRELYKIIGSLDIIGNPIGLFNDISTGVEQLFYEPFKANTLNPKEFSEKFASGASTLISKTIHGTFSSASKLTGSIGKGIELLTFDDDYIKEREKTYRQKPSNLLQGLLEGTQQLGRSIFDGATGIFTQPVRGAQRRGGLGFFTGLGKGVLGIPTKPIAGVFKFAQRTTEGISNIGQVEFSRKRCIRFFREDGCVVPYDPIHAFMIFFLSNIKTEDEFILKEIPTFFVELERERFVFLTKKSVILIKMKNTEPSIHWRVLVSDITNIQIVKDTKNIKISYESKQKKLSISRLVSTEVVKGDREIPFYKLNENKLIGLYSQLKAASKKSILKHQKLMLKREKQVKDSPRFKGKKKDSPKKRIVSEEKLKSGTPKKKRRKRRRRRRR